MRGKRTHKAKLGWRGIAGPEEETVWHEVAYYFGLNKREVRAAERRRR